MDAANVLATPNDGACNTNGNDLGITTSSIAPGGGASVHPPFLRPNVASSFAEMKDGGQRNHNLPRPVVPYYPTNPLGPFAKGALVVFEDGEGRTGIVVNAHEYIDDGESYNKYDVRYLDVPIGTTNNTISGVEEFLLRGQAKPPKRKKVKTSMSKSPSVVVSQQFQSSRKRTLPSLTLKPSTWSPSSDQKQKMTLILSELGSGSANRNALMSITKLAKTDVVNGRGSKTRIHNMAFRKIVKLFKKDYTDTKSKNDKNTIANFILTELRKNGARFLKIVETNGDYWYYEGSGTLPPGVTPTVWSDVGDAEALAKIKQAIREKKKTNNSGVTKNVSIAVPTGAIASATVAHRGQIDTATVGSAGIDHSSMKLFEEKAAGQKRKGELLLEAKEAEREQLEADLLIAQQQGDDNESMRLKSKKKADDEIKARAATTPFPQQDNATPSTSISKSLTTSSPLKTNHITPQIVHIPGVANVTKMSTLNVAEKSSNSTRDMIQHTLQQTIMRIFPVIWQLPLSVKIS